MKRVEKKTADIGFNNGKWWVVIHRGFDWEIGEDEDISEEEYGQVEEDREAFFDSKAQYPRNTLEEAQALAAEKLR